MAVLEMELTGSAKVILPLAISVHH